MSLVVFNYENLVRRPIINNINPSCLKVKATRDEGVMLARGVKPARAYEDVTVAHVVSIKIGATEEISLGGVDQTQSLDGKRNREVNTIKNYGEKDGQLAQKSNEEERHLH